MAISSVQAARGARPLPAPLVPPLFAALATGTGGSGPPAARSNDPHLDLAEDSRSSILLLDPAKVGASGLLPAPRVVAASRTGQPVQQWRPVRPTRARLEGSGGGWHSWPPYLTFSGVLPAQAVANGMGTTLWSGPARCSPCFARRCQSFKWRWRGGLLATPWWRGRRLGWVCASGAMVAWAGGGLALVLPQRHDGLVDGIRQVAGTIVRRGCLALWPGWQRWCNSG